MSPGGSAGNEEWLADFRGGWGSFNDRLALLCEIGEVATARRLEAGPGAVGTLEPGELAGALTGSRARTCRGATVLVRRGRAHRARAARRRSGGGLRVRSRRRPPRGAPLRDPAAFRRSVKAPATASRARCRARGWTADGPLRAAVAAHPEAGCSSTLPYRPALAASDPEPFVRAFERASAPRAGRRPAPTSRARARRARRRATVRGRSTCADTIPRRGRRTLLAPPPVARRRAHRRLGRRRRDGRPQPRHERLDVHGRSCRATRAALRSHRRRGWWPYDLDRRLADRTGRSRATEGTELAAVARDASHVVGRCRGAALSRDDRARRNGGAHRARPRRAHRAARRRHRLTGATVSTRGGLVIGGTVKASSPWISRSAQRACRRASPTPRRPGSPPPRPGLCARPLLARCLRDRRRHRHQRRWAALSRPRRHRRSRARARGACSARQRRLARGHRPGRSARARVRQRGHARNHHLCAAPAAPAGGAPGSRRVGVPQARAGRGLPRAAGTRRPGPWPANSSTNRCWMPSITWRPASGVERRSRAPDRGRGAHEGWTPIAVAVQCVEEAGGSAREARSDEEIEIAWNTRRSSSPRSPARIRIPIRTTRPRLATSSWSRCAQRRRLPAGTASAVVRGDLGDGNLHPGCTTTSASPGVRARAGGRRTARDSIANGGTLTGEHSIGPGEAGRGRRAVQRRGARRHKTVKAVSILRRRAQSRQAPARKPAPMRAGGCSPMSPELRKLGNASVRAGGDETGAGYAPRQQRVVAPRNSSAAI